MSDSGPGIECEEEVKACRQVIPKPGVKGKILNLFRFCLFKMRIY